MTPLQETYLVLHRRFGLPASVSLRQAREMIAEGKRHYYMRNAHPGRGVWQPLDRMGRYAAPSNRAFHCDDWPEGWRLTGRADQVCRAEDRRMDHTGWYTDDDGDTGTLAGYVLQLPARDGKPVYIPGTKHTDWHGVTLYPLDSYEDKVECARTADGIAERAAEVERDYQRAWRAGQDAATLAGEVKAARGEILTICRDLRTARRSVVVTDAVTRLCKIARDKVSVLLDDMRTAREKIEELRRDYGREEAFREGYAE